MQPIKDDKIHRATKKARIFGIEVEVGEVRDEVLACVDLRLRAEGLVHRLTSAFHAGRRALDAPSRHVRDGERADEDGEAGEQQPGPGGEDRGDDERDAGDE